MLKKHRGKVITAGVAVILLACAWFLSGNDGSSGSYRAQPPAAEDIAAPGGMTGGGNSYTVAASAGTAENTEASAHPDLQGGAGSGADQPEQAGESKNSGVAAQQTNAQSGASAEDGRGQTGTADNANTQNGTADSGTALNGTAHNGAEPKPVGNDQSEGDPSDASDAGDVRSADAVQEPAESAPAQSDAGSADPARDPAQANQANQTNQTNQTNQANPGDNDSGGHSGAAEQDRPLPVEPGDAAVGDDSFTVTLLIKCDTLLSGMDRLDKEKRELVPADGVIFYAADVAAYDGESVFNILTRETKKARIHMAFRNTPVYNSAYIEAFNNLYAFDAGELSGWMYSVNGWYPNYGCSRYRLEPGDVIVWSFTCDLGRDLGRDASGGWQLDD